MIFEILTRNQQIKELDSNIFDIYEMNPNRYILTLEFQLKRNFISKYNLFLLSKSSFLIFNYL